MSSQWENWEEPNDPEPDDRKRFRCAVPGCTSPGTMSHSICGGEAWYCARHFFDVGDKGGGK